MAKKYKAVLINYDELTNHDSQNSIMCCLSSRQIAILKSAIIPFYWATRWQNLSITVDELDALMSEIDYRLDGNDCECDMLIFRENPDDNCEVQYSNDGGLNWFTMFRKDTCANPSSSTTITNIENFNIANNEITTNNTTYNNDITNVAPAWEATSAEKNKALCVMLELFVDAMCEHAIEQINKRNQEARDSNDWVDDLTDIIASVGFTIIGLTSVTNPISAAVALAIVWASERIANAAWDYFLSIPVDSLLDEEAREEVKCHIYQKMMGITPTWDIWKASLNDFSSSNPNAEIIADVVEIYQSDLDVFINWMMYTEDLAEVAYLFPECQCPVTWELFQLNGYGRDYTYPLSEPIANPGDIPEIGPGYYVAVGDYYTSISVSNHKVGNIYIPVPINVQINTISIHGQFDAVLPLGDGDKNQAVFMDDTYIGGTSFVITPGVSDWSVYLEHEVNTTIPIGNIIKIHTSLNFQNGFVSITEIHMTGTVI